MAGMLQLDARCIGKTLRHSSRHGKTEVFFAKCQVRMEYWEEMLLLFIGYQKNIPFCRTVAAIRKLHLHAPKNALI